MMPFKFKSIFPAYVKRNLLYVHRIIVWRKSFRKYLKIIDSGELPDMNLIRKLRYGWGNTGWSAKEKYLESLLNYAYYSSGLILECGCGLTTLLIGAIAKKRNQQVLSLEHMEEWANKVSTEIIKYHLTNNTILITPLKDYGNFYWYDVDKIEIGPISLCICDAPPGNTPGGRKGLFFLLVNKFTTGAIVLVDDTIRTSEKRMLEEWREIANFHTDLIDGDEQYAVLTIE